MGTTREMELIKGFVNTPPLWNGSFFDVFQFTTPEVDLLYFNVLPIDAKKRLGHQMEAVLKQVLDADTKYEVVVYNLPIRENKITLGEIDFIIKDTKTLEYIHIELAYKFYVIDPTIDEPIKQLIGPNRRDSFEEKINKIKNRQFKLIESEAAQHELKKVHVNLDNLKHTACFKGQLYVPYQTKVNDSFLLNTTCIYGYWLPFKTFNQVIFSDYLYYIPNKWEWVIEPHNNVIWKNQKETALLITEWHQKKYSPMVWIKKSETVIDKCFVVFW